MYSILHIEFVKNVAELKILSIALFRYENNEITDQLISILNPETLISKKCEARIGLSNKQLQKAPKFYEIAKRILEITKNTLLVCFDKTSHFSILKEEFESLGFSFNPRVLDLKIQLEKMNLFSKNVALSKIYKAFGIPFTFHFSTKLNGLALVKLFKILKEKDLNRQFIQKKEYSEKDSNLFKIQRDLPHETGVFYIHDKKGTIIFLEGTSNIYNRVNQLFTSKSPHSKNIQRQAHHITFNLTGSVLIASIKALVEIQTIAPVFNKNLNIQKSTPFNTSTSFLIIDKGQILGENSFILIKKGFIAGYGYYHLNNQMNDLNKIETIMTPINETKEIHSLVHSFIKDKNYLKIIDL
ncbi:MAG: hypothetical protein ACK5HU_07765 [Flavobacteriales bacterium]